MSGLLNDTLQKRLIFLTGKGGVGKTTLTFALALAAQRKKVRVAVAQLGVGVPSLAEAIPSVPFTALDPLECFKEYALRVLKFNRIYETVFHNHVLQTFLKTAPGLGDTVLAGKLWDWVDKRTEDLILVDMPSSGHALSFFRSPIGAGKLFKVGFVQKEVTKITQLFQSPTTRIDFVALPEDLPVTETLELKEKLTPLFAFHFGFLFMNGCLPQFELTGTPPSEMEKVFDRFSQRKTQEAQAIARAQTSGLPLRLLDTIPEGDRVAITHRLSERLESL